MSMLKNIYRQIRNEYMQGMNHLRAREWLRTVAEIARFPPATLKKSHVHTIFQTIDQLWLTHQLGNDSYYSEYHEATQQLWDSLLRTDGTGLLNPAINRQHLLSHWLVKGNWGIQTLETIARYGNLGATANDWLRKIRQQKYMSSAESIEKAAIAYEQLYRLAGNRDEKYRALLTAWEFRFSFKLYNDIWLYKRGKIDELLEEHIRHFPEDIPRLRKVFRELIIGYSRGQVRRAGWAGIAVIGAGPYEPELLKLLHLRLGRQSALGRESTHARDVTMWECNLNMWTDVQEEIEGMTRWIPDAQDNRRILLETWKWLPSATHRLGKESVDVPTLLKDGNISVALWRARLQLETSEEQLLKEITATMDEKFAEMHQSRPGNEYRKWGSSDYKIIGTLGTWQPKSPEIRQRWRELWENCLVRSWDNPHIPEEFQGQFWKSLVNIAPQHPRLAEFLMEYLATERNREPHYHFRHGVVSWLKEYGLPPETPPDIRKQLAETAQNHLREMLSCPAVRDPSRSQVEFMLHILLATATDPEGKKPPEGAEVVGEVLQSFHILQETTDWLENNPPPAARLWQPIVHSQWEKRLSALTPQTPSWETRAVLLYFARIIRRDPAFEPPASFANQMLSIIREYESCEEVVIAARLGGQLAREGRMNDDFFTLWHETVRERERQSKEGTSLLDTELTVCLHLIRKEALLYEISARLNDNPFKKAAGDGTEKTIGKKTGERKAMKADQEVAEKIWLRELIYLFRESHRRNCPGQKDGWRKYLHIWSPQCLELIETHLMRQRTGKATDKEIVDPISPLEASFGRSPVFLDKSRPVIPLTTPGQMCGAEKPNRQPENIRPPEDVRGRQVTTIPNRC